MSTADGECGSAPADFESAVGAPPEVVDCARRARFARRLLEQTDLPVSTIAAAVGAPSAAALEAMLGPFGFDAAGLRGHRRAAERDAAAGLDGAIAWTEPFWRPNDVEGTLGYLASRGIPGVVTVADGCYRRVIRTSAGLAVAQVEAIDDLTADVGQLRVRIEAPNVPAECGELLAISAAVRRLFALDSPAPTAIEALTNDPVLGPAIAAEPGRRLAGAWDRFETAIRIIIGQQVTVAAASTLTGRVVERCAAAGGPALIATDGLTAPFPSAAVVAAADLADIGMPRTRIATIGRFAAAVADGTVSLATITSLEDTVAMLCEVKGIGPWTAELIAARVFNDPDAFPPKDLGLRRAYEAMGGTEPVEVAAERWRPDRAAAIAYLWARA